MASTKRRGRGGSCKSKAEEEGGGGERGHYEESRAKRIKENLERMKSLGIADLSNQLKRILTSSLRKTKPPPASSNDPPRRSYRLKEIPRVSYSGKKSPKKDSSSSKEVEIHIPEGKNPEIYTDGHEKMLGDSTAAWNLYVDGFDEDGQRIYDPLLGKSCHQCRQKTLGQHTKCSMCTMVSGQFCGDCLFMRYGENVSEANLNEEWVCPVCRGICNCSRCRRDKGWNPTGAIYKKVVKLGFKSVAHYLIHTRREGAIVGFEAAERSAVEEGSSDNTMPQSGAKDHVIAEDTMELNDDDDDDDECEGDSSEEEQGELDSKADVQ